MYITRFHNEMFTKHTHGITVTYRKLHTENTVKAQFLIYYIKLVNDWGLPYPKSSSINLCIVHITSSIASTFCVSIKVSGNKIKSFKNLSS